MQNSPSKSASVIEFGEVNYKKIKDYVLSRSPIKMKLIDHQKYNSLVFNEQCNVSEYRNVNFSFEEMDNEAPADKSRTVDICTINNEIECDNCYYTLTGRLLVDPGKTKLIDSNRKVKEDNVIVDQTGQVGLRV